MLRIQKKASSKGEEFDMLISSMLGWGRGGGEEQIGNILQIFRTSYKIFHML